MTAVVDASVVSAYILGQGEPDERRAVLGRSHAPRLLDIEVTQTLRGLLRGGKIDAARADAARTDLGDLPIERHAERALLARAWELRDVCTVYDALYVALAEALASPLLTRDHRLARGLSVAAVACDVRVSGRR